MMRWMLTTLLLVGGCERACEGLDEAACSSTPGCAPIDGWAVLSDAAGEACVDYGEPQEFAGCAVDNDSGCDDAMTPATATPGDCTHYLPNSCLPDGWSTCEEWTDYAQCES